MKKKNKNNSLKKVEVVVSRDDEEGGGGDHGGGAVLLSGVTQSRIFNPYKNIGLVSSQVPLILRYIHKRRENFVITCAGRSISTYVSQQLRHISSSEEGGEIGCMAGDTYHVYTVGPGAKFISAWRRGTELTHEYPTSEHASDITHLLPFAENLISVDSKELVRSVSLPVGDADVTSILHPLTFQNKVIFSDSEGFIYLWNINTNQLIYKFDTFKGTRINSLMQSPARGVLAVALASGHVSLFNLEYDKILMHLTCLEEPVSLAFMTDGRHVLLVGGVKGSLTAWDLDTREVISFVNEAHKCPVSGLVGFMGEPIFVSSGADNAIRVWIFDRPDGGFRLLNTRAGHSSPPTMARFHGEDCPTIVTTGEDNTLRSFHLYNETYNRIITNFPSTSSTHKPLSVNSFTNFGGHHQPIGEDILAFDKYNASELYTFSFENSKRGKPILPGNDTLAITCVAITTDIQWALVGFKEGKVHVYNLQSKRLKSTAVVSSGTNTSDIAGIALSASESTVLIAAGVTLSYHKFPSLAEITKETSVAPFRSVFSRRTSNLACLVRADFSLTICDVSTQSMMRILDHCCSPVTDGAFSPDMKWVTVATTDGCVFTWDVPTGNLVDIFRNFPTAITSLDYTPRGDFLVTTHADEVGIRLWVNLAVFAPLPPFTKVPDDYIPKRLEDVIPQMPPVKGQELVKIQIDSEILNSTDPTQNAIELGTLPKFHWKELLNLKTIKARNKPAPAFKPERNIPFILSDLEKEKTRNLVDLDLEKVLSGMSTSLIVSKPLQTLDAVPFTAFSKKLSELGRDPFQFNQIATTLISELAGMGPSQIDLEIWSWDPDCGGSKKLLMNFLELVTFAVGRKQHLQIVMTCLALFFKIYRKQLKSSKVFKEPMEKVSRDVGIIRDSMFKTVTRIECLVDYSNEGLF
ncbi:WD repeat-containing protein 36 [Folsomia candida]|uniref:WD repeat-containing protein 36 n=1 Tax=Folsomia candida TaxID=158441 RepID=A0A226DHJ3_FOLCA|nr:WD repeat-containing protein 36 [Folsomia candida]